MRWFRPFLLVIFAIWLGCSSAFAEKRVALVIGNSNYQKVARLSNPVNDATAIAAMLRAAGFDLVESRLNLGVGEMRRTLRDFGTKTRDADMAVHAPAPIRSDSYVQLVLVHNNLGDHWARDFCRRRCASASGGAVLNPDSAIPRYPSV